jgi:hypothetical protein
MLIRGRNLRGALVAGTFLILLGGWLLASNVGWEAPGPDRLWPALPVVFGLASLIEFFAGGRRDAGLVFTGVAAVLAGVFFFTFTLGRLSWNWAAWWPALVLIAGAAYLAQWSARPREWGRLILAGIALVFGGLALGATQGALSQELVHLMLQFWPAALILAGLGLLAQAFLPGRRR